VYPDTGTFKSHAPVPYYGIDLGTVASWETLPGNPFTPNQFFSKDVTVTFDGSIGFDQWIFAAADTNGVPGIQAKNG